MAPQQECDVALAEVKTRRDPTDTSVTPPDDPTRAVWAWPQSTAVRSQLRFRVRQSVVIGPDRIRARRSVAVRVRHLTAEWRGIIDRGGTSASRRHQTPRGDTGWT